MFYPRWMYHATEAARLIETSEDFSALTSEWCQTPGEAAEHAARTFAEGEAELRVAEQARQDAAAAEIKASLDKAAAEVVAAEQAAKDDAELQAKIAAEVEADIVARMAAHQEQESGKPTDEDKPR